jgi:hypothetical protein
MLSGWVLSVTVVTADSGTSVPAFGGHIKPVQGQGVFLEGRQQLQQHFILVGRPVDLGNLLAAKGVAQRGFDLLRRHPQARRRGRG